MSDGFIRITIPKADLAEDGTMRYITPDEIIIEDEGGRLKFVTSLALKASIRKGRVSLKINDLEYVSCVPDKCRIATITK